MRVLLVANANELDKKLAALNPELEYCAIIVDDVESAKKILERVGLSQVPLYPMNELKACVETLDYDYVFCLQKGFYDLKYVNEIKNYNVSKDKLLSFGGLFSNLNFKTEQLLRYYREHSQDFEMFVTGISYTAKGIDVTQFRRKLIKFAKSSQDLYYDFQVAKYAMLYGRGHSKLHYVLIGLAPYSFHFDLSKGFLLKSCLLPYVIAFDDIHNFYLSVDVYKKFFRAEWLTKKLSFKSFNVELPYTGLLRSTMDQEAINRPTDTWNGKYYPETREENIKILDDYLTLCEGNNIRPVMFMVPVTEKSMVNFNPQLLEEFYVLVEQACKKHPSAVFFDGWKLKDFTYMHFYDHEHMNQQGAAKFSVYLNDFIEGLDFNYYRDLNNFHNCLNDSIEELEFCNHFEA